MQIDQPDRDDFDVLLKASLRNHAVNIPPDFAQRLLTRIQRQEYAAALAALKLRERLLLAAMILLPLTLGAVLLFMPSQIMSQLNSLLAGAGQMFASYTAKNIWPLRYWIAIAVAVAMLLYGLSDALFAED